MNWLRSEKVPYPRSRMYTSKYCYTNGSGKLPVDEGEKSKTKNELQDDFNTNAEQASHCISAIDKVLKIKNDISYTGLVADLTALEGLLRDYIKT